MSAAELPDDASVEAAILGRRTSLRMETDRPVDHAVVDELCRLATWAPNHHRTEPWRFAAFTGDGRSRLGHTIAERLLAEGVAPERVAKTRTKYLRAPVMLAVGSIPGADDVATFENQLAVAAGIQNLLLAATSLGLASYWSSVATPTAPELLDLCGFPPGTTVIAAIYLGHAAGQCPAPPRQDPVITWVG